MFEIWQWKLAKGTIFISVILLINQYNVPHLFHSNFNDDWALGHKEKKSM